MFHILYDGSVVDEQRFASSAATPRRSPGYVAEAYRDDLTLQQALRLAVEALGRDSGNGETRTLPARALEVAGPRPRQTASAVPPHRGPELDELLPEPRCALRQRARRLLRMERRIFGLENEYGVTCTLRGQRRLAPTRSPATCSAGWCPGAGAATSSSPTAPGSTSTSAATPSTPRPSATRSSTSSPTTRPGSGSSSSSWSSRAAPPRGGHPRRHLPVQEQHRLGRQQLRLPRELPRRRRDDFSRLRRGADPVLRLPADLRRRRQGAADRPRGDVLHRASGPSTSGRACRSATTRSRPIINTRDEPHADAERYRRLHVIVGDSNMSEYATFLKVGATDLAAHARGPERASARPHPREPDPGHPRDQPRHHLPPQGAPRQRPRGRPPSTSRASTSPRRASTPTGATSPPRSSRRSRCGSTASSHRSR